MRTFSTSRVLLGSCLLTAAGLALAAAPQSMSDKRGYSNCVKAAGKQVSHLDVERKYYTNTYADSRAFYLNGRARVDGQWEPVRITCETSRSGHRILDVAHESGRYLGRTQPSVAQN